MVRKQTAILIEERASSLLLSSVLLLIGMIVLGGLLSLADAHYRISLNSIQTTKVKYMAEAGLYKAIAQLQANPAWREGFQTVPFGEGTVSVQVMTETPPPPAIPATGAPEANPNLPVIVSIRSEGRIPPKAIRTVHILYDVTAQKILDWK